jgi:DNA-binding MarR family transcriptional regulator
MATSSSAPKKSQLLDALGLEVRRMSAQGVLLSGVVAERVGLSSSDLECLDLILMAEGSMTAGKLAASTGLSTGAVTGLIDRLERIGYVRREADPQDRRKVRVVAELQHIAPIGRYYEQLKRTTTALWSQYSVEQLQTVLDFVRRSADQASQDIEHIRSLPPLAAGPARKK